MLLVIYLLMALVVSALGAKYLYSLWDGDIAEDKLFAVLLGLIAGVLWPLSLVGAGIYWLVFKVWEKK